MIPSLVTLRDCAMQGLAGLMLAGALAGCGGGGGGSGSAEGEVTYFGPVTDTTVDFALAGTVRYEDKLLGEKSPGLHGFTGATRFNAVRFAVVDVVNENGQVLATTRTDDQGRYALTARAAGLLRLRILARTDGATGMNVEIRANDGDLLAVTRYFVPGEGHWTLDTDIPVGSIAGAFNILDLYTAGAEFLHAHDGVYPQRLIAYWSPGSRDGTYFTGNTIHVCGGCPGLDGYDDTDEYDDDVLLHEYGHFIESLTGNLDSPGGYHALNDSTQDLRLAWSEGWASFASGTIKTWIRNNRPGMLSHAGELADSYYLDTAGDSARVRWVFDVNYLSNGSRYASSETSVARVLWNLSNAFDFSRVWTAYRALQGPRPVSLETYWEAWQRGNGAIDPVAQFAERRVNYLPDPFETDDTLEAGRALNLCADQGEHALYKAEGADVDYFDVTLAGGTQYGIETFALTNGAHTELELLDSSGNLVTRCGATHDADCRNISTYTGAALNDGSHLASRLLFTASAGQYHLRVAAAPNPAAGAGRYGAYRIAITPTSGCP